MASRLPGPVSTATPSRRRNPAPQPTMPAPTAPPAAAASRPPTSIGNYFQDPLLQGYLNFGQNAIGKLTGPQQTNGTLQQAIDALTRMTNQGAPHVDTSFLDTFRKTVEGRQAELAQPGYSQSQQDILRTNVTEPIENQKIAARQQVLEHLGARGIDPNSGIAQQAIIDSDRNFQQQRTTGERQLATTEIAQDEARKNQSVDIGSVLAQLGLSTSGLELQAQTAGRGQNLSAAGALAGIGSDQQNSETSRLLQAMGIYGNMAQLPFQANANAINSMNAINGQHVPTDTGSNQLIQLLMGLAGQGEGVNQNSLANNAAFWEQLGTSLPGLLSTFGQLYTGSRGRTNPNGPAGPPPAGGGGYG